MSKTLVKDFTENLGFEYLTASTKEEFEAACSRFVAEDITDKPMVFEIFPETDDEIANLDAVRHIKESNIPVMEKIAGTAKSGVKTLLKKIK